VTERLAELAGALAEHPWIQGLLVALGTLILEDPMTVTCGLLVADGKMTFMTALLGLWGGIAVGDVALYGVGRAAGPAIERRGWVSAERLTRSRGWFRRNLISAVVVSRFVPGMRLPTYLAAGALKAPFLRFLLVAVGATLVWTVLLLVGVRWIGSELFPLLGRARWPVAIVALFAFGLYQRWRARKRKTEAPIVSSFEFWPPWLFYLPLAPYYLWLTIRYRGWLIPTCANPSIYGGGLIGESKQEILELVPKQWRHHVAKTVRLRASDETVEQRMETARRLLAEANLDYPLVAKPDIGQRGAGIRPLGGDEELYEYLTDFPAAADLLLQRRVDLSADAVAIPENDFPWVEAGVFWWRLPGRSRGEVVSITLKQLPVVIGDGRSTLRELIEADPRATRVKTTYFKKAQDRLDSTPHEDERVALVFAGNHCQGAIFRDGREFSDAPFARKIDEIACSMKDFTFGRFDVRFADWPAFISGEAFEIIEINGAGGEMTHIWDARATLGESYLTLFHQWQTLFRIGRAARDRGVQPLTAREFFAAVRRYRSLARSYPDAR
jgi:membrane protein DedA with SNARE-associated domain